MTTTLVFFPGKRHGQGSLAGCSPQGHKELGTQLSPQSTHTASDSHPQGSTITSIGQELRSCTESLQSGQTLCDPTGCRLPGSSVHRILQARIPERAAVPSSRGSSQPRGRTCVPYVYLHWQAGSLPLAPPLGWMLLQLGTQEGLPLPLTPPPSLYQPSNESQEQGPSRESKFDFIRSSAYPAT